MTKRTKSSSRCSTHPVKKPRSLLTVELTKELLSPQGVSDIAGAIMEIPMPIAAAHEITSNVVVAVAVIPETVSKTVPTTSEPNIVIVARLGTCAILSPPIMIPRMVTPPRSPIIRLVSSRKFHPQYFIFLSFSTFVFM